MPWCHDSKSSKVCALHGFALCFVVIVLSLSRLHHLNHLNHQKCWTTLCFLCPYFFVFLRIRFLFPSPSSHPACQGPSSSIWCLTLLTSVDRHGTPHGTSMVAKHGASEWIATGSYSGPTGIYRLSNKCNKCPSTKPSLRTSSDTWEL